MEYDSYTNLLVEQNDVVLKITLNRPEVLNALSRILREELDDALLKAAEDDSVRVIIIAGAGRAFSAGHDLGSPQEVEDRKARPFPEGIPGEYKRTWDYNIPNTLRWRDIPKPTIAQVHGYCIMGGMIVASACDLIVASEDARFCDRTVRWSGPHVQYLSLPWDIGVRKAKEYIFTGDWITADEACRLGLVNRVVPADQLEDETMALAQRIGLQDPFALRLAKQSLNLVQDGMGFRTGILNSFQVYAAAIGHRMEQREDDPQSPPGMDRARQRDERFGDRR